MTPPTPIHIIPRDGEDEGEDDGIIQNISTLGNEPPLVEGNNNDNGGSDDALSLSTATSATSIASALSDGAPRPRSASFNLPHTSRPNSTPRQRSTPRSRPRSNPRTRTPMRHESPLLVMGRGADIVLGGNVVAAAVAETNVVSNGASTRANDRATTTAIGNVNATGDETDMIRNIFNTNRRHRSRAGSIPEETEAAVIESTDTFESIEVVNESNNQVRIEPQQTTQTTTTTTTAGAPRTAGHWLAQAATSRANHRSTNPTRSRNSHNTPSGLSDKQRPSHRKIRRWNNDRFVGTSSEQIHVMLESGDTTDMNEMYWREFYMPNYPCEYRSEFAKLSTDESKVGKNVRERFLKGEVAHREGKSKNKKEEGKNWMERSVMAKFQKMGLSSKTTLLTAEKESGRDDIMGKKLFCALSPRIQSVLSRSCTLDDNAVGKSAPSFASQVVEAFEHYLVSLALAASKKEVTSSEGYPPQQSQCTYDLFEKMFAAPPKVVMRNKRHKLSSHNSKHTHAVLVPTVHFYFNDNNRQGNGQATSTAFCRILLYAVCQFHGLESSSSVMGPKKGKHGSSQKRGAKVVTVQGGVLLAPALKLLDFVQ